MKKIDIGKSGVMGSEIALGCMRFMSLSPQELDLHIHTAVEQGINFFDHADVYSDGECETAFGKVLTNDKSLREKVIIQGKCGIRETDLGFSFYDFSKEHILTSVDGILSRLGVEQLDLLLLHRPDNLMNPDEVAEAFNQLESSGKVAHFGVSNFNPNQTELLQSSLKQKIVANQMQFSVMHTGMIDAAICANTGFDGAVDHDGGVLDYCRLKNITLQAWSPFQYGFFEGVFIDNDKFPELNKTLDKMAKKYGVSKSAISVAWVLRHPANMQCIVGTTNTKRLVDICTAANIELERQDWYELYVSAGNIMP